MRLLFPKDQVLHGIPSPYWEEKCHFGLCLPTCEIPSSLTTHSVVFDTSRTKPAIRLVTSYFMCSLVYQLEETQKEHMPDPAFVHHIVSSCCLAQFFTLLFSIIFIDEFGFMKEAVP